MDTSYHELVKHEDRIPAMIAILNEVQAKAIFPSTIFIPAHWHRSLEIAFIKEAEVILQIGESEKIIDNDFTCVNSGVVHSLRAKSIREQAECIILLLSYDFMKQYCPEIDHIQFDLNQSSNPQILLSLFYRLKSLYLHQAAFTYLEINACLLDIFKFLLEECQVQDTAIPKGTTKYQKEIKDVLTYLHEHYQEDLSLIQISETFHVSKEHFSRQFHHYVGKTYRDYLSAYRLYQAYEDVIHSDRTIQEIAMRHGFLNVRSFIKVFGNAYACTPLKYRMKYQENDKKSSSISHIM